MISGVYMGTHFSCIGLTGGIATGKSTVSTILQDNGFDIIDADKISREVSLIKRKERYYVWRQKECSIKIFNHVDTLSQFIIHQNITGLSFLFSDLLNHN
jgi:hypothetical protein